jgi:LmbE family N-acetylglucosaminyl deacetylase
VKGKAPPLHVYLSPHLDDAVLSCGGAIHRQVSAGEPVLVITFFAGEPPAEPSLSPFALVQHGYWGNPLRPMDLRRAEDKAALTLLGAEAKHLDFLDAVYRVGVEGEWLYAGEEAIFGEVQPADPLMINGAQVLVDCLVDLIPHEDRRVVYAPLGAGHHVDHQVVHVAARRLVDKRYRLAFYEDYPYAQRPDVVAAALAAAGGENWPVEVRSLAPSDLMAKVSALAYYRTQMAILFGGAEAMPSRLWACAAACSPQDCLAERIFWPQRG